MKYKVSGNYSKGLRIYNQSELILYSTIKRSWLSRCTISIFDSSDKKILKIKEIGFFRSKYKVELQDKKVIKEPLILADRFPANSELNFKDGSNLVIKRKWIQVVNPVAKIVLNNKEIGTIRMKLISLERNYEIDIFESNEVNEFYSLILFLSTESNNDPDY